MMPNQGIFAAEGRTYVRLLHYILIHAPNRAPSYYVGCVDENNL